MIEGLHIVFITCAAINGAFWVFYLLFFKPAVKNNQKDELPSVTVLICCRNDFKILTDNISHIKNQHYEDFNILVVNDYSDPDQNSYIDILRKEGIRVINNTQLQGKKYALRVGIEHSDDDCILLTDADCRTAGSGWIRRMISDLGQKKIVVGYGGYDQFPGLLNEFIRFETISNAIQYMSFAHAGLPYMAVGRNLMYTRQTFCESTQMSNHLNIRSGDDDLFINEVANRHNIAVCKHPDAHTYSTPKKTWKTYFLQKNRHVSTAIHYRLIPKMLLALYQGSFIGFYLMLLLVICFDINLAMMVYGLRLIIIWPIFKICSNRLGEIGKGLFPLYDIILCLVYFRLIPATFKNNNDW